MVVRLQSSLGNNVKQVDADDFNINNLYLAKITKVNYKYQTVEFQTKNTYAGQVKGSDGKYSAPIPKSFIGKTPEGVYFGEVPLITPGSTALVGFINGEGSRPIVLNVYGDSDVNKLITPTPIDSGDFSNEDIFRYGSAMYKLYPSLTYDFIDGEGTVIKTFNGKSFFTINSNEDEQEQATDFYTGTSYGDLYPSHDRRGDLVEPRNQRAPKMLFKHQGDIGEDNHITTIFIGEDGTYRVSNMDTEKQKRTTQEISNNNYRVKHEGDSLLLDEGQVWVEYGIDSETNSFYIKNDNNKFEFTDKGILVNERPILDALDDSIQNSSKELEEIKKQIEDIDNMLSTVGKENIEELIKDTKNAIEVSKKATDDVNLMNTRISDVSSRAEGIIQQFQDFRDKTYKEFYEDASKVINSYNQEFEPLKNDVTTIKKKINSYDTNDLPDIYERLNTIESKSFNTDSSEESSHEERISNLENNYTTINSTVDYIDKLSRSLNDKKIPSLEDRIYTLEKGSNNSSNAISFFNSLGYKGSINELLGFIENDKLISKDIDIEFKRNSTESYKGRDYGVDEPIYDLNGLLIRSTKSETATIKLDKYINTEATCYFTFESSNRRMSRQVLLEMSTLKFGIDEDFNFYVDVNGKTFTYNTSWNPASWKSYDIVLKWSNNSNTVTLFVNNSNSGFLDFGGYKMPDTKEIKLNTEFDGAVKEIYVYDKYIKDRYI